MQKKRGTSPDIVMKLRKVLANAKRRGVQKQVPFELTLSEVLDMWDVQGGACALSGKTMITDSGTCDAPSLDQIRPGEGYVLSNVQLVTTQVNISKSTLPTGDYIDMCERVYFTNRRRQSAT